MNFEEFKIEVLARARREGACVGQYKRALASTSYEELAEVIKDNINWNRNHSIVTSELANNCDKPEIWNTGNQNVGLFNIGDRNNGDRNSGDLNSGDRNSGDRNSGDRNSGDLNIGDLNSGYRNSGDLNSGDRNSGCRNIGDLNSGDRNSGDLNSGYRNSGVFCNRKDEDTVTFFNKESDMTWDEWYNHPAYHAAYGLDITSWISWDSMTDEEKEENPKAFICEGYLKEFTYHEAWANLWCKLNDNQKNSFKTLPNFDSDIFKEITGICL